MPTPRELLHRLFEYIGEQLKQIDPRGYKLSGPGVFVRRRTDLAGFPGVRFDLQIEGDHVWMRVDRLDAVRPPAVPERHAGLIRVDDNPEGAPPSLNEAHLQHWLATASKDKTPEERKDLEARGRIAATRAITEYTILWNAWAIGEKPRRRTISLYGELFALKHALESEETAKPVELVWGIGITTWQLKFEGANVDFEYPMLTQAMEISLDEKSLALEVRPRSTNTRAEFDAFVACSVKGAADAERAVYQHIERNKERPVTPFDAGSYTDVLKLVAGNLDSEGSYREVLARDEPVPRPGKHLVVTDAWVLLSRPRSNNVLVDDLHRLQAKLKDNGELPEGVTALVSPPSDEPVEYAAVNFRGLSSRGDSSSGEKPIELFFPLPYNEEQVTIVSRLERAAGVTVQGPPGTGKTHTIANIICHYLANGRRVLVTSKGEPALAVLQQKIPEEVQPLTVALLTSDREGIRQFQASIESIQHQVSQLNPALCQQEIETLKQAIDRAHAELAKIDRRIDEIAHAQLADLEVDGVPMRAQKLAELVVAGREKHGWFDDEISFESAPPLTEEEGRAMRDARRTLGLDLTYVRARVPSADDFPGAAAIAELHAAMCRIREFEAQERAGSLLPLISMTREVLDSARQLLPHVERALALAAEVEAVDGGWPMELRMKCRLSSFVSERQALESLFSDLDELVRSRAETLKRPVYMSDACLASVKARQAIARGAESGKPFSLVAFGAGEVKELVATVKVSGLAPTTGDDWGLVHRYVALHERVLSFCVRWNGFAPTLGLPKLEGGVAALRAIELTATAARKAHELAMSFDKRLPALAQKVFAQPPVKELVGGPRQLDGVRQQLVGHLSRYELSAAATQFSALQEKLGAKNGPVTDELRQFLGAVLGNKKFAPEHVAARFTELMAELRRIASLASTLAIVRDSAKSLADAGASRLGARVQIVPVEATGEDATFPVTWLEAWTWARMRSHLDTIEARDELIAMFRRRIDLEGGLAKLYRDMVGKTAWLAAKRNATPKVLQALAGYSTAIRRIGMGTGPNAVRFRRDAREAMLDAAGAVPCWIMSHFKVSESMPANIGAFDLVIVDEASQSDLWALPAIVRGAKILVVGDDKQVSPDPGFIDSQRVIELKNRFLTDQPYGMEMTPEKSLYELAARVFAAEQVMLREHFRCVPPIIAYSNRNFYDGAMAPLRIPKASERIDPPLVDIYTPDGARNHRDCNHAEADAIVAEIKGILADERLADRTLGVISLLGFEQAKHIDSLVRRECDAAELLHRKFECGDARTFQGSERDIMFLSMVVDRQSCKAVSGNMFEQRFNVAGSRARDRMYLVRSVEMADLSDKDLRQTLLTHFSKPMVVSTDEAAELVSRCESGFEREVFTELTKRGYRVIPQVKSNSYRLDMVVEGENDRRLAIECDGDEFHGPDRWAQDTLRQRVLERAGWTFWRCFASTWVLRKEEVMLELLNRLTAMGIGPIGAADRAPALVEKRVWKAAENRSAEVAREALESAVAASKDRPQVPARRHQSTPAITTRYLTKSRFKLGAECPTKLFYAGKADYVDRRNEDNFLLALADGGFQVGRLAQMMHPGGVTVDEKDPVRALARTQELLAREQVTIFEAALAFQNFFIRVDILKKAGNEYDLIEVKAKSYSASEDGALMGKRGGIKAEFKPYLLDVCFQRFVARQALPAANFRAFLMMVDKETLATVDGLNRRFQVRKEGGRTRIDVVERDGNTSLGAPILTLLNVDGQLDVMSSLTLPVAPGTSLPFDQAAVALASAYAHDRRIDPEPSKMCGDCQFRADHWPTDGELKSGFHECWSQTYGWGPDDFKSPTVLDLWNFRGKDDLIQKGVVKASQVQPDDLAYDGSPPGVDGLTAKQRQWYVCRREWPGGGDFYFDSDGVQRAMADWRYPLHFIDFETSMAAIPFTKGKRPYQLTAFQFSHHQMYADGSVKHTDQWLGAEPGRDPNADFVRALKGVLSRDQGSIFRWAPHENTVLNTLRTELLAAAEPPADQHELVAFIESITTRGDNVGPRNMVDLWDLSGKFFFHPATKGSAALKKVLPALMSSSARLKELYGALTYGPNVSLNVEQPVAWWQARDGVVVDPYSLLPPLFADFSPEELAAVDEGLPEEVREGGVAMVAYARLQSEDLPEATRKAMERGLLRYCELDTLAMAMVVQAWQAWIASN